MLRTRLIRLVSALHDQLLESIFSSFSSEMYSLIQLIALNTCKPVVLILSSSLPDIFPPQAYSCRTWSTTTVQQWCLADGPAHARKHKLDATGGTSNCILMCISYILSANRTSDCPRLSVKPTHLPLYATICLIPSKRKTCEV